MATVSEHYRKGSIQAIQVIDDWGLDFALGNVVKYLARYKDKGGREDLIKAAWYLTFAITGSTLRADAHKTVLDKMGETK